MTSITAVEICKGRRASQRIDTLGDEVLVHLLKGETGGGHKDNPRLGREAIGVHLVALLKRRLHRQEVRISVKEMLRDTRISLAISPGHEEDSGGASIADEPVEGLRGDQALVHI